MKYGILSFDEPVPDTSRKILHVDMDAFYANVEIRDQPQLANKPVVIAKHPDLTGGRGIVSTCNYEARKYGIHSAMSAQEAYRRCPKAIFIPGRHSYYRKVSHQIRKIYTRYTDLIEPLSLDEAYLDVTNNKLGINSGVLIAQKIQRDIYQELKLTCSVGVSYNKFIAKIASDYHKPFGVTLVTPEDAPEFLKQLPIKDFYGVGKKTLPKFEERGIKTGEDLLKVSLDDLIQMFGKMGYSLYFKVRGIHNAPVVNSRERKSIGKETTFRHFLETDNEVLEVLSELTHQVINILNERQYKAYTVTIKVRYEDFETMTRQHQLPEPLDTFETCFEIVEELWQIHGHLDHSIRLLGVTVSNFADPDFVPISLFH